MASDIVVPALGESVTEATVTRWLKKVGDAVAADEPLVELETEKVSLEVNAAEAGVLSEVIADEGANVEVGALLGRIEAGAVGAQPSKSAVAPAEEAAPAPPKGNGEAEPESGKTVEVVVPELGESVTEAIVATWLKQPGEAVAADTPLVELETEKVAVEVNAPGAGALAEILAEQGAAVEVGAVLARFALGAGEEATPASAADSTSAEAPGAAPEAKSEEAPAPKPGRDLDPSAITASGKDGRLTKADVESYLARLPAPSAQAPTAPTARGEQAPAPAAAGPREERVRMTKLRQTVARRLKEAQDTAAMLTTFNEIDMSQTMAVRAAYRESFEKKHGVRLGFTSFFTKAVVKALQELPAVNARIEGDEVVYNKFYDIGMAVSTPNGLMVPVVRDCDAKSFAEIEGALADLAARGRDGKLGMDDMKGGSFTITNGGVFGSLLSTPILNMPQSGILGLHKIEKRPIAVGDEVVVRPMMYVALTYDHRIIDGREAVTFLVRVKEAIEDPSRLLLDL
jgi:2-oxoglutarate dehydrogenase E2 component (dihydrolipoamide succinyltransferase)